ncbi:MAG: hypothetical protein P0S95_07980 [Rhabdochlamydiaceae bacterium]|nr:hypothetical protein [Candidatus Amphrikana amoebophyrae]
MRAIKHLSLSIFILTMLYTSPAHALFGRKSKEKQINKEVQELVHDQNKEGYTVNFPNVSVKELIGFISQIGKVNFIYDETDLDFNISFTSQEPTSLFNIMSAFTQILRIHGLYIIEDGNNLVIHKNESVKQIPTIVSEQTPLAPDEDPIIITRVFNIHNANPVNIEAIIHPMLTSSSLITVSEDTRQIIITDTRSNVYQVAELITILDTPKTNLDVALYKSKNADALQLTPLLNQIIMPISEGNPIIIVPQKETNSIFLVSTPYLLEKAKEILRDLDTYSSIQDHTLGPDNILLYKLKYKTPASVEHSLKEISKSASNQGFLISGMLEAIQNVNYIKQTHSLLFIGDTNSLARINVLLNAIDVPNKANPDSENSKFYIFEPQNKSAVEIMSYLKDVESHLEQSHLADPNLLNTLSNMSVIPNANTIIFTGDSNSIAEIERLLKTLDLNEISSRDEYFMYTPIHLSPQTLIDSMHQVADRLAHAGNVDQPLIRAIKEAKYATYSHSIIFTGSSKTIKKIKELMTELDHTNKKNLSDQNMLIYQLKFASKSTIEKALDHFADSLPLESPVHEAIETLSWMPEAHSIVFRGTQPALAKIKEVLVLADTSEYAQDTVFSYRIKHAPYDVIKKDLDTFASQLPADDPTYTTIKDAKYIPTSKILVFRGPKTSITKIQNMLTVADETASATPPSEIKGYYIYNLKDAPGNIVMQELATVKDKLKDDDGNRSLVHTIDKIEWIPSTNSLFITGPQGDIDQVKKFVAKFDAPQKTHTFLMIKLKHVKGHKILQELHAATERLNNVSYDNDALRATIKNIEYVKSSDSLFISGPAKEVAQVGKMVAGLDVASRQTEDASEFFIYHPKNLTPDELEAAINKLSHDLKDTRLSDPVLLRSLDEYKYNKNAQTFVFTGSKETLTRIKELLATIDINRKSAQNTRYFIYKPVHLSDNQFEQAMENVRKEFEKSNFGDMGLVKSVESMRYVKASQSFLFTGSEITIEKVEALVKNIDVPVAQSNNNTNFLLYQPKNVPIKDLASSIERVTKDLKRSDFADQGLIKALETMRTIENSNTLLFTGLPDTLHKVDEVVAKMDVSSHYVLGSPKTHFYIYRPPSAPTKQVQTAMEGIRDDLEKSGLANPALLSTLQSMRFVSSTDSLLFTGSQTSIDKVKVLLKEVDEEVAKRDGIQKVGKTTFLVYRLKESSPKHVEKSLRGLVSDLQRGGNPDKLLIKSIEDMRYVKDNNSIIFTGTEPTLKKIQEILGQFDTGAGGMQRIAADVFQLYKPRHIGGAELIHLTKDFEGNLVNSGVNDPRLFDTINNLKWMPKTGQVLVSGDKQTTEKVIQLLEKFDTPIAAAGDRGDNSIETLDNVSFLIYKLQFHQGAEIQAVLGGIANDLKKTGGNKASQELVNAINSLQWLKVTNSFIATGEPKVLLRLKELLESIDVPLKQVFIEVLVIETTLTGRLEFGLRWGAQGDYKNRMAFSGGNVPASDSSVNFSTLLPHVDAANPPLGTNMPITGGGSLGVIGDLIFHKGKTYVALGDFITAIQQDSDGCVVLNQKIIAQDNQNATLFVGENVPYNGSVVTNKGDNTTISANIEYRDIGIRLSITPNIGEDDIVSLDIDQSITEDTSSGSSGGSVNSVFGITTRKTTMRTKVHVPNKHFVALSGQIRNSTSRVKTAVPCLGGLPIIGAAFTESNDTNTKSNIIMFLKPVIVNSYADYKKLTNRQEDIYRDQAIAEDFDTGLELIQGVD